MHYIEFFVERPAGNISTKVPAILQLEGNMYVGFLTILESNRLFVCLCEGFGKPLDLNIWFFIEVKFLIGLVAVVRFITISRNGVSTLPI